MQQRPRYAAFGLRQAVLSGLAVAAALSGGCAGERPSLARIDGLRRNGRWQSACAMAERLVDDGDQPKRTRLTAMRRWVDCLDRLGELRVAEQWLDDRPAGALVRYGRALVWVARDPARFPEAIAELRRAARSWPHQAEIPYRLGVLLLADEQADAAVVWLRRACRLEPAASCQGALAHALLDLGKGEQALAEVREMVDLEPGPADVRRGLALVRRVARRRRHIPASARKAYDAAVSELRGDRPGACVEKLTALLAEQPQIAPAHTLLGLAQLRLGNSADAVVALREAARLAPYDAKNPLYMAVIYASRGQHRQAVAHYRRALELNPFLENAARELGRTLYQLKRYDKAADVLDHLVAIAGKDHAALRLAGRAHLAAGRPRRAAALFRRLLRLEPKDFEGHLRLAQILAQKLTASAQHDETLWRRARWHAERAAAVRPADPEVKALQARLGHDGR